MFETYDDLKGPVQKRIQDCVVRVSQEMSKWVPTVQAKGVLKDPRLWSQAQQIAETVVVQNEQTALERQTAYLAAFGSQIDAERIKIHGLLVKGSLKHQILVEETAVADLEQQIGVARETKHRVDTMLEYPWSGLANITTSSLLSFSLKTYTTECVTVAFSHMKLGLETDVCYKIADSSYDITVTTLNDGGVPAALFRALLCNMDGSIRSLILEYCQSNDLQEFLQRFAAIVGRMEDAGNDLMMVTNRSYVQSTDLAMDNAMMLHVAMDHGVQLQFLYDLMDIEEVTPYSLTVLKNGEVNDELEAIGVATSGPIVCTLQNACDTIHKATLSMESG
jgi:hypothetical protein